METPEDFLIKYGICSDTTIGIEGDKKLTELLKEYATQALRIHEVSHRKELLVAFVKYLQSENAVDSAVSSYIDDFLGKQ